MVRTGPTNREPYDPEDNPGGMTPDEARGLHWESVDETRAVSPGLAPKLSTPRPDYSTDPRPIEPEYRHGYRNAADEGPVSGPGVYQWHTAAGPQAGPYPPGYDARYGPPYPYGTINAPNVVVMPSRPGVNHPLHLVLTLLTCGLWAPVWIVMAIVEAARR